MWYDIYIYICTLNVYSYIFCVIIIINAMIFLLKSTLVYSEPSTTPSKVLNAVPKTVYKNTLEEQWMRNKRLIFQRTCLDSHDSFHWSAKLVDLSTKLCTTCAPNMDWHNLFKEVSPKPETEDQTPKENTVTQIRIRTVIIGAASFFLITKFEKSSLAFPCNAVKGKLHLRKILAKLQETGTKGRHQRERNTKQQKNYPHSRKKS